MAAYEYRCTNCGKLFEEDHPFGQAMAYSVCTACAALAVRSFRCNMNITWRIDPLEMNADKEFEDGGGYEMFPETPRGPRDHE